MKFKLTVDVDDYLSYHLYQASKSKILKKKRLRNWVMVPAVYFITGFLLMLLKGSEILSLIFYVTGVLWIFMYPFYSKWAIPRYMRRQIERRYSSVVGKEGTVEINKKIITLSTSGQSVDIPITDVADIVELTGYFIVEFNDSPGLILPKGKVSEKIIADLIKKLCDQSGISVNNKVQWKWK